MGCEGACEVPRKLQGKDVRKSVFYHIRMGKMTRIVHLWHSEQKSLLFASFLLPEQLF